MDEKIRVLILEDVPDDAELVEQELKKGLANYTLKVTDNKKGFVDALKNYKPDLILSDYSLPQFNGMEAIILTKEISPLVPVIIVTGSINEEIAVECIKAGAKDYVLKENLSRLGSAISQALEFKALIAERIKVKKDLQENEEKYRALFELAHDAIFMADDKSGIILDANKKASQLVGYSKKELIGRHQSFLHPKSESDKVSDLFKTAGKLKETAITETNVINKDGSIIPVEISSGEKTIISGINVRIGIFRDITERKKSEITILEGKQKLELMIQNSPDLLMIQKTSGEISYASPQCKEILGFSAEEIKSLDMKKQMHPNDVDEVLNKESGAFKGDKIINLEYRFIKKNGDIAWLNHTARPIIIDDEISEIQSTVRNITKRKLAEEKLRQNEIFLIQTQEISKVGGWSYDVITGESKFTNETYKIYGLPIGDLPTTEDGMKFYHPDDRKIISEAFSKIISEGKSYDLEVRFINAQGKDLFVRTIGKPVIENGKVVKLTGAMVDISARKQTEIELKKSEQRFRSMFENHSAVMLLIEPDSGEILDSNKSATEFYGYTSKEITSMNIEDINTSKPAEVEKKRKLAETKEVNLFNFEHRLKNNTLRDVQVHSTPIELMNKTLLFSIIYDITDRKKAEEMLHQRMDELEIFNDAAVDREIMINDHRKEINELLIQLGKEEKYEIVE